MKKLTFTPSNVWIIGYIRLVKVLIFILTSTIIFFSLSWYIYYSPVHTFENLIRASSASFLCITLHLIMACTYNRGHTFSVWKQVQGKYIRAGYKRSIEPCYVSNNCPQALLLAICNNHKQTIIDSFQPKKNEKRNCHLLYCATFKWESRCTVKVETRAMRHDYNMWWKNTNSDHLTVLFIFSFSSRLN